MYFDCNILMHKTRCDYWRCRAAASATTDDAIQVVPLPVRLRQFIARSKVVHRPGCRKKRISTLSLSVNFLRPEHHLFLHS